MSENNQEILILVKELAQNQKALQSKSPFDYIKDYSFLFGIFIVIGGWIWYFATDHAVLEQIKRDLTSVKSKNTAIESQINQALLFEKDVHYLKEDLREIKEDIKKLTNN